MLVVGVSWVMFWGLVQVFHVEILLASLITGIILILVGLISGERPIFRS